MKELQRVGAQSLESSKNAVRRLTLYNARR
jgi:hypothetical protein